MPDIIPPERGNPLRTLITASVISKVADYGLMLIIPLAVLAGTSSAASAIFVFALRGVAYAVSPVIGVIIDRYDRKVVFLISQIQQAMCVAIAGLFLDNTYIVALLMLLSGLGGVTSSIAGTYVLLPRLIAPDRRADAVARLSSAVEFAKVAGFIAGGVTFSVLPPTAATWIVAALYATAGLPVLALPTVAAAPRGDGLAADLRIGFSWLAKPEIGVLVACMAVSNLALGSVGSVLVTLMGRDQIQPIVISGTLALGLLVGAFGARAAPYAAPAWGLRPRILLFQAAAAACLIVIAMSPPAWAVVAGYAGLSFALGLSNVASITFRQEQIPIDLAGRVNSVIRMFIAGAIPLSGMIYAWAEAQHFWIWLPAVVLQCTAVATWAAYTLKVPEPDVAQ